MLAWRKSRSWVGLLRAKGWVGRTAALVKGNGTNLAAAPWQQSLMGLPSTFAYLLQGLHAGTNYSRTKQHAPQAQAQVTAAANAKLASGFSK